MTEQNEYLLSIDDFGRPVKVTGKPAISLLVFRLIMLEPGSDPLHPEMGVGFRTKYRFAVEEDLLSVIKSDIKYQISKYLPDIESIDVDISINDEAYEIRVIIDDEMYTIQSKDINDSISLDDLM